MQMQRPLVLLTTVILILTLSLCDLPTARSTTPLPPTIQIFSVNGTAGKYKLPTIPAKPLYLRVRLVGAGGGGSGPSAEFDSEGNFGAATGTSGANGSLSSFGPLIAGGGGGGLVVTSTASGGPGSGGVANVSLVASKGYYFVIPGSPGQIGSFAQIPLNTVEMGLEGGSGAASPLGDGGFSSGNSAAGYGGGGAGAYCQTAGNTLNFNCGSGSGGGSGAYVEAVLYSPALHYNYAVGSGGAAGSLPTVASPSSLNSIGTSGSGGCIIVEEFYQ